MKKKHGHSEKEIPPSSWLVSIYFLFCLVSTSFLFCLVSLPKELWFLILNSSTHYEKDHLTALSLHFALLLSESL